MLRELLTHCSKAVTKEGIIFKSISVLVWRRLCFACITSDFRATRALHDHSHDLYVTLLVIVSGYSTRGQTSSRAYLCVKPFQAVDQRYVIALADEFAYQCSECYFPVGFLSFDVVLFGIRFALDQWVY